MMCSRPVIRLCSKLASSRHTNLLADGILDTRNANTGEFSDDAGLIVPVGLSVHGLVIGVKVVCKSNTTIFLKVLKEVLECNQR